MQYGSDTQAGFNISKFSFTQGWANMFIGRAAFGKNLKNYKAEGRIDLKSKNKAYTSAAVLFLLLKIGEKQKKDPQGSGCPIFTTENR